MKIVIDTDVVLEWLKWLLFNMVVWLVTFTVAAFINCMGYLAGFLKAPWVAPMSFGMAVGFTICWVLRKDLPQKDRSTNAVH